jgi:hypothetical protein
MDEAIEIPPFPLLTWNGYSWVGKVVLPSWAGFQSRSGPYASVSENRPSDGSARLTVEGEEKSRQSPEQVAAFRHLLDNEVVVARAVGVALLNYYPEERAAYLDAYDLQESEEVSKITEVEGLRVLVGLSSVHVLSVAQDGVACSGFEFGCVWDTEHGGGVMTPRKGARHRSSRLLIHGLGGASGPRSVRVARAEHVSYRGSSCG